MHRIDSATARQNLNGTGKNGFHDNADLPNQDATYLTPEWCNTMQEEVANVIEGLGTPLDKLDNKQLLNILTATFAKNTALQNAINDYNDKFLQQNSRVLALENRVYEYIQVGELFITSIHFDSSAQVAIHKGYGTWERDAEGEAIIGYSSQADSPSWTQTTGSTFGEYEHQLKINELPPHNHAPNETYNNLVAKALDVAGESSVNGNDADDAQDEIAVNLIDFSRTKIETVGNDEPHNNVQPSKIYGIWRRIA